MGNSTNDNIPKRVITLNLTLLFLAISSILKQQMEEETDFCYLFRKKLWYFHSKLDAV